MDVLPDPPWAEPLVSGLWDYATSLWKYLNGVVHLQMKEDERKKDFEQVHKSAQAEYNVCAKDKFLISPQFSSLFTKKAQ